MPAPHRFSLDSLLDLNFDGSTKATSAPAMRPSTKKPGVAGKAGKQPAVGVKQGGRYAAGVVPAPNSIGTIGAAGYNKMLDNIRRGIDPTKPRPVEAPAPAVAAAQSAAQPMAVPPPPVVQAAPVAPPAAAAPVKSASIFGPNFKSVFDGGGSSSPAPAATPGMTLDSLVKSAGAIPGAPTAPAQPSSIFGAGFKSVFDGGEGGSSPAPTATQGMTLDSLAKSVGAIPSAPAAPAQPESVFGAGFKSSFDQDWKIGLPSSPASPGGTSAAPVGASATAEAPTGAAAPAAPATPAPVPPAQNMAAGGIVQGRGTPTSDSVPVNLSR